MSYGSGQPQFTAYAPSYPPAGYGFGQPVRQSAPPSVHVVAILHYLGGALLLLAAGLIAVVVANPSTDWTSTAQLIHPDDVPLVGAVLAGGMALIGLIAILIGRKLQRGRQWARVIVLLLCVLSVAAGVFAIVVQGDRTAISGMIFPAFYLILLNTRAARSWFHARTW